MEYLLLGKDKYYIKSILGTNKHLLKVEFADSIPTKYPAKIELFTSGGYKCAEFTDFTTIWKKEGNVVWLSDDGSVYEDPEPVEPTPPYVPTLEETKAAKRAEISVACQATIHAGVDVKLTNGSTEHFSLSTEDQLNLFGKQVQMATGAEQYEYHADGQPCKYYSAADMQTIITAAMQYVSYHTTYCNSFFTYIEAQIDKEVVQAMRYGDPIPEEYKSEVLKAYEATA